MLTIARSMFVGAVFAVAASGCSITPARLAMPADLPANAEVHAVTGHSVRYSRAPVAFGPWSTRANAGNVGEETFTVHYRRLGMGESTREYHFDFVRDGGTQLFRGNCASSTAFLEWRMGRGSKIRIPTEITGPALVCMFNGDRGHAAMTVTEVGSDWQGQLDIGDTRYLLQTLNHVEGVELGMGEGIGFAFRQAGRTVAVVDLLGEGRVLFAPGLDAAQRDLLAAAAAGLLLKA